MKLRKESKPAEKQRGREKGWGMGEKSQESERVANRGTDGQHHFISLMGRFKYVAGSQACYQFLFNISFFLIFLGGLPE